MRSKLIAPVLFPVLIACGGTGPAEPPDSVTDDGDHTASGVLTSNAEIAAATFVDLDFSRFPALPVDAVPANNVLYVAPGGDDSGPGTAESPFRTVAHAVRTATAGYTIVVRSGEYSEAFEADDYRALVLQQDDLTLMAYPGETVRLRPATGVHTGLVVNARNLVIRGIDLVGFSNVGVLFEGGAARNRNIVLADLDILGSEEAVAMWDADGSVDEFLLYNVTTDAMIHCGTGPCSSWRLESVTIDASSGEGWGADAFAIESGDNFLLVDVHVLGAGSDGIDTKATRVVVFNSLVRGVENNAVKLWHGGDVINTVIMRGWANPIVVEEGRFRLLHGAVGFSPEFTGHSDYSMICGYDLRRPLQIEIVNSIIANPSGGMWVNPESSDVTIRNSIFYTQDGSNIFVHGDLVVDYTDGTGAINAAYGTGNLAVDPLLDADLRPSASSPAIDAGVELMSDFPAHDCEGNDRVRGAAPDVGPYER